jgi:hypothetical protein
MFLITTQILIFLLFYSLYDSVKAQVDGLSAAPFEVFRMEMESLEQPMANNKCGFYVMWAMYRYIGGKQKSQMNWCVCFPCHVFQLNKLLFCLTFVDFETAKKFEVLLATRRRDPRIPGSACNLHLGRGLQ